jgi:hypothetical protein
MKVRGAPAPTPPLGLRPTPPGLGAAEGGLEAAETLAGPEALGPAAGERGRGATALLPPRLRPRPCAGPGAGGGAAGAAGGFALSWGGGGGGETAGPVTGGSPALGTDTGR